MNLPQIGQDSAAYWLNLNSVVESGGEELPEIRQLTFRQSSPSRGLQSLDHLIELFQNEPGR